MKQLLALVMTILAIACGYAQTAACATLSKSSGEITHYYGLESFIEAYNASEDGDAIYLSKGAFNSPGYIQKGLTIRGAGMDDTALIGYCIIQRDETINTVQIEGLSYNDTFYVQSDNCFILKSKFNAIEFSGYKNISICNCNAEVKDINDNAEVSFINSYINFRDGYGYSNNFVLFTNCVITADTELSQHTGLSFDKCIVICSIESDFPINSCAFTDCVLVDTVGNFDLNNCTILGTYYQLTNSSSLFKEDTFYELTDTAAATYIDSEGEPIGMYSGTMPYSPTPTNPQIGTLTIGEQSTSDGTLPITIEIK